MNNFGNNFGMGMNYGGMYGGNNNLNLNLNHASNDISNNTNNIGGNNMNYKNQNQNKNQQQKQDNYEPARIDIEPVDFEGLLRTKLTTTVNIAKMVNELFRPVFSDYEGCLVLPNQSGGFETMIYFKDSGIKDERLTALQPVIQQSNQLDITQRIANMNMRYKNKTYDLTQDCKEIFEEFMMKPRNGKIKWNEVVVEKAESSYNGYSIHVLLNNVDIMKIIKKVYGGKVDGRRIDYSMKLERGLGAINTGGLYTNYLVSIMQLDTREVEKIAQSVGMVPLAGNIPMVK